MDDTNNVPQESTEGLPYLYGMPFSGVNPLRPSESDPLLQWTVSVMSNSCIVPLAPVIYPAPAVSPPPGEYYPIAQCYMLERSSSYQRGCVYITEFESSESNKAELHDLMCRVQTPPQVAPHLGDNGEFVVLQDVPGMIKLVPGIPMATRIDGDPLKVITVACVHTLDSLDVYHDGSEARQCSFELLELIWGRKDRGKSIVPPFYVANLKQNLRAGKSNHNGYNGSHSLAVMKGEGEGVGVGIPALQHASYEDQKQISLILRLLQRLYRIIMPHSVSRFEMEMIDFNNEDNNVFSFGGFESGNTGLQANVSCGIEDLFKTIGAKQGAWHCDRNDCRCRFTLLTVAFRLPPGSDSGPFMLGRHGLYMREQNVQIIYLVFKGVDLHSGFHPSYSSHNKEVWLKDLNSVWESTVDRVALVSYPTEAICNRLAPMSISPPLHFGNLGQPISHKARQQNFSQNSRGILGDHESTQNRLGREAVWTFANQLYYSGLEWDGDIADLYARVTYKGTADNVHPLLPPRLDVRSSPTEVHRMRQHWVWYVSVVDSYHVWMTKDAYKTQQARLHLHDKHVNAFTPMENSSILPRTLPENLVECGTVLTPSDMLSIAKITRRYLRAGEVTWSVCTEDMTKSWELSDKLRKNYPLLRCLFDQYVLENPPTRALRTIVTRDRITNSDNHIRDPVASILHSHISVLNPEQSVNINCGNNDMDTAPNATFDNTIHPIHSAGAANGASSPAPSTYNNPSSQAPSQTQQMEIDHPLPGSSASISTLLEDAMANTESPSILEQETTMAISNILNPTRTLRSAERQKRKRSEMGSDAVPTLSNNEYYVASIEAFRINDLGVPEWRVRWEGYDERDDTWLGTQDLQGSKQLVLAFNNIHDIDRRHFGNEGEPEISAPEESEVSDDDASDFDKPVKPKKGRKKKKPRLPLPSADVDMFRPKRMADKSLSHLLDSGRLNAELEELRNGHRYQNQSQGYKAPVIEDVIKNFVLSRQESNYIASAIDTLRIPAESETAYLQPVDCITLEADLIIFQLQEAAASLPKLLLQTFQLTIVERAIQVETCRSLVAIYDWLCNTGPSLATRLFKIHRSDGLIRNEMAEKYPEYARAVDHIFQYVKTYVALHAKVPNRMNHWIQPISTENRDAAITSLKNLSRIPATFFGIVNTRSKGMITLGKPKGRLCRNPDYVYEASQQCFMDALSKQLLSDSMSKVDKIYSHAGGSRIYSDDHVQSRCVARGIILHTLAEICQSENIFASTAISTLLVSPTYMLVDSPELHKPSRFVTAYMKDKDATLATLRKCISSTMDDGVGEAADNLGNFVHHRMLEFDLRHPIDEDAYLNTSDLELLGTTQTQARPRPVKSRSTVPTVPTLVQLERIWTLDSDIPLGKLAVLLREVLNKSRQLPAVFQEMRDILDGVEPGGKGFEVDDDYMNPVRELNAGTRLMRIKFNGKPLTSAIGLSNILVWMGTGQGYGTKNFINQGDMWFLNSDACIDRFTVAYRSNLHLTRQIVGNGKKTGVQRQLKIHQHPSYIKFDNMRMYGTANNWLGVIQTVVGSHASGVKKTHSMDHKFQPYFSDYVQNEWLHFLGPLADQYPDSYNGERRSWRNAYDFITGTINLLGFGRGLTALQTSHVFAFFGLCKMPTAVEMATWISENPTLGACGGLKDMGFAIESMPAIRAAFLVVYDHLDKHLSVSDKSLLRFGPIFVEHALCKVPRWTRYLKEKARVDLTALGQCAVLDGQKWIQYQNVKDETCFPMPITIELDNARSTLQATGPL